MRYVQCRALRDTGILEVPMSQYTNRLHDEIRTETTYWDHHTPQNGQEYFQYAEYQWKLKDYRLAHPWLERARKAGIIEALYRLGEAYWNGYGCRSDSVKGQFYFQQFIVQSQPFKTDEFLFFRGNCYAHGWGVPKDTRHAKRLYEMMTESARKWEVLGILYVTEPGFSLDAGKAYFLRAMKEGSLLAPFYLYAMSGYDLLHFPYKNTLFEHFSFMLGRLIRVAELHPCREYYERLAAFYEDALPYDYAWNTRKFAKLADHYRKLGNACPEEEDAYENAK